MRSALATVLAAPVSTSALVIKTRRPACVTVNSTKGRSSRSVNRMVHSYADPALLDDVEFGIGRVYEAELPLRVCAVQLAVTFHRRRPVCAGFDDCDAIKDAALAGGVGLDRLDDQPLIRMRPAHVVP